MSDWSKIAFDEVFYSGEPFWILLTETTPHDRYRSGWERTFGKKRKPKRKAKGPR